MDAGREARPRWASVLAKAAWRLGISSRPDSNLRSVVSEVHNIITKPSGQLRLLLGSGCQRAQPPENGPHFLGDGGCFSVFPTLLQRMRLRQEARTSSCRSSVHKAPRWIVKSSTQRPSRASAHDGACGGKQRRTNLGSMLPRKVLNWLCSEALFETAPRIPEAAWFHALLEVAGLQFGEPA